MEQAGLVALIPPHERDNEPQGKWGKSHFRYFKDQDIYLCPAEKVLKRIYRQDAKKRDFYQPEPGSCKECQYRGQCSPSGHNRTVSRFIAQELVEKVKERLASPWGQEVFSQRKTRIEGIFAIGKQWHGLRRAQFRGKWKVQIQFWLIAAVINIKRAIKEMRQTGALQISPRNGPLGQTLPTNSLRSSFNAKLLFTILLIS